MAALRKTNKSISDFEGQEPDYEAKLEFYDTSKNHNKYWHIQVYGYYVVRRWGRHGSKGQTSVHHGYGSRYEAESLVQKKRDKGYTNDRTTILDRLAREV